MKWLTPAKKLWFFWFVLSLGLIFQQSACDSMFIKRTGVGGLPLLFVINAIGWLVGSQVFMAWGDRMDRRRLLRYALGAAMVFCAMAMSVAAFWSSVRLFYYLIVVINEGFWMVFGMAFWALCNDIFDIQDAKRQFSLISTAQIAGFIVMGLLSGPAIALLHVTGLFFVSLGLYAVVVVAMGIPGLLPASRSGAAASRFGATVASRSGATAVARPTLVGQFKEAAGWIKLRPFFVIFAVLSVVRYAFPSCIRFEYLAALDTLAATEDAFGVVYSHIWAITNVVVVVLQALILPRLTRRFSSMDLILILPVVAGTVSVLQYFSYTPAAGIWSWVATNTMINTLEPVYYTFSNPVPEHLRGTVQTLTTGFVRPVGVFLAAIVMYLRVSGVFSIPAVYAVALGGSLLYLALWAWGRRQYLLMLSRWGEEVPDSRQVLQELALCSRPGRTPVLETASTAARSAKGEGVGG